MVSTPDPTRTARHADRPRRPHDGRGWPAWARVAVSLALAYHATALLAASLAPPPSSAPERALARAFRNYFDFTEQGYAYRFYARLDSTTDPAQPRPWSVPVVTAELEFTRPGGATATEFVRFPSTEHLAPRLRYQRQIDLAYHLATDPRWAASYARHLCKTRGCERVTLYAQDHRIPDLALAREAAEGHGRVDLEDPSDYGPRTKLGEFRCDEF
jgi:hypothetical protein